MANRFLLMSCNVLIGHDLAILVMALCKEIEKHIRVNFLAVEKGIREVV